MFTAKFKIKSLLVTDLAGIELSDGEKEVALKVLQHYVEVLLNFCNLLKFKNVLVHLNVK